MIRRGICKDCSKKPWGGCVDGGWHKPGYEGCSFFVQGRMFCLHGNCRTCREYMGTCESINVLKALGIDGSLIENPATCWKRRKV